jgi:hypothetical protein
VHYFSLSAQSGKKPGPANSRIKDGHPKAFDLDLSDFACARDSAPSFRIITDLGFCFLNRIKKFMQSCGTTKMIAQPFELTIDIRVGRGMNFGILLFKCGHDPCAVSKRLAP